MIYENTYLKQIIILSYTYSGRTIRKRIGRLESQNNFKCYTISGQWLASR